MVAEETRVHEQVRVRIGARVDEVVGYGREEAPGDRFEVADGFGYRASWVGALVEEGLDAALDEVRSADHLSDAGEEGAATLREAKPEAPAILEVVAADERELLEELGHLRRRGARDAEHA